MSIERALRTESLATDGTCVDRGHGRGAVVRADVARQLMLVRQRVFTDGTHVLLLSRLARQWLDLKGKHYIVVLNIVAVRCVLCILMCGKSGLESD